MTNYYNFMHGEQQTQEKNAVANLQVKGIDDSLYDQLKRQAAAENRSVSQEIIHLVKVHLSAHKTIKSTPTPAEVLLQLAGSWEDSRPAKEIVSEIRGSRQNSKRLSGGL